EEGIGGWSVTGVQRCALAIYWSGRMGKKRVPFAEALEQHRARAKAPRKRRARTAASLPGPGMPSGPPASPHEMVVVTSSPLKAEIGRASCRERGQSRGGRRAL